MRCKDYYVQRVTKEVVAAYWQVLLLHAPGKQSQDNRESNRVPREYGWCTRKRIWISFKL